MRRLHADAAGGLITADGSAELKQRARLRGVALLHKPVKPAALRALLAALARSGAGAKPILGSGAAAQRIDAP